MKKTVAVQMRATLVVEMIAEGCEPVTMARWDLTPYMSEIREAPDGGLDYPGGTAMGYIARVRPGWRKLSAVGKKKPKSKR